MTPSPFQAQKSHLFLLSLHSRKNWHILRHKKFFVYSGIRTCDLNESVNLRSLVRFPVKTTLFFHVPKFANFAYCAMCLPLVSQVPLFKSNEKTKMSFSFCQNCKLYKALKFCRIYFWAQKRQKSAMKIHWKTYFKINF